jgi:hypothetical protein
VGGEEWWWCCVEWARMMRRWNTSSDGMDGWIGLVCWFVVCGGS